MPASIQHLAQAIKTARRQKGLSQRALSAKVGVAQSHISKIENGVVDVQASNLIEIARALDMEVMLVPRQMERMIETIGRQQQTHTAPSKVNSLIAKLNKTQKQTQLLISKLPRNDVLKNFVQTIESLKQFQTSPSYSKEIQQSLERWNRHEKILRETMSTYNEKINSGRITEALNNLQNVANSLEKVRHQLTHNIKPLSLPAYRLEAGDDDG